MCNEAVQIIREELAKPIGAHNSMVSTDDFFDPWRAFPCLYGRYSSEFDDVAITTLENVINWEQTGENVAHEMFREMLCTADLCDYGTSPRVCFPNFDIDGIDSLLSELLTKWKEYRTFFWND